MQFNADGPIIVERRKADGVRFKILEFLTLCLLGRRGNPERECPFDTAENALQTVKSGSEYEPIVPGMILMYSLAFRVACRPERRMIPLIDSPKLYENDLILYPYTTSSNERNTHNTNRNRQRELSRLTRKVRLRKFFRCNIRVVISCVILSSI